MSRNGHDINGHKSTLPGASLLKFLDNVHAEPRPHTMWQRPQGKKNELRWHSDPSEPPFCNDGWTCNQHLQLDLNITSISTSIRILVSHLSTDWFNHISKHWLQTEPTTCFTIIVLPYESSPWEPRQHPAKDHMLPVQPRSCGKGDEELWKSVATPLRDGDVWGPRLMGFSSIFQWGFSRFHLGNWGKLRVTVSF